MQKQLDGLISKGSKKLLEEKGSGTITIIGVIFLAVVSISTVCSIFYAFSKYNDLKMVSDITALVSAKAAQNGENACEVAEMVSEKNEDELVSCQVLESDVRIKISSSKLLFVSATSQAGPSALNCPPD
ncbi:MAG: flp pilus-assembly TadE/G-like family protein [Candidatus Ancillula sp.]|jgi:secretion/DNA translocation related TadE-like protein|nr:flp pilus-assembly TadE/G-like family protein [Candidatus Ancillula sp.]